MKRLFLLAAALPLCASFAAGQEKAEVPFYGNQHCPVEPDRPADRRFFVEHEGQRIYTSGRASMRKVQEEPAAYLEKAYPRDKVQSVKISKCVVMGREIPEGAPSAVWQGYRVPLCCSRCLPRFQREPSKYLTLALRPDVKVLGNTACPLMEDEKVEPDTFIVYKKQIIGLCCQSCVKDALEDPERALKAAREKADR